jgi:hypothetical protein
MKIKMGRGGIMLAGMAFSTAAINSAGLAEDIGKATLPQLDASHLTYARLYCTPDNESHFAELTAELAKQNFAPPAASINIGGNQPASSVFFAGFEPRWGAGDLANHLYHPNSGSSDAYCGSGRILDHNDRWADETVARRRRGPS